ncbi:MAG: hydroxyphenylacetyl-CoA thioesterase PaaI [Gammaproteobacteria bacterium]|nr:hydroxyphenylacetyl-CoA thioesterase PaaI [Gammaproteobacteria bacterium]MDH4253440.1 hydroxyphenylacetyl-CoA thioesterase PaaI [Gammaproteobacteria bacterium]MDH5309198.1 hydroxyphenylacetyl-CoA thioesterase PaaI [Gammaproteobacteria bacterium]
MNEKEMAARCAARMFDDDAASRELGIRIDSVGRGSASAVMTVTGSMLNGFQVCHGGFLFTLADSAFAYACNSYNVLTLAAGGAIEFLRPAALGDRLTAVATERSRGGRSGIYDVSIVNQRGEEIALFRGRSHATRRPVLPEEGAN